MTKKDIKTLNNGDLIVEYVRTYSAFDVATVLGRGGKALGKHMADLEEELVKRDILTEEHIKRLEK